MLRVLRLGMSKWAAMAGEVLLTGAHNQDCVRACVCVCGMYVCVCVFVCVWGVGVVCGCGWDVGAVVNYSVGGRYVKFALFALF